MNKKTIILILVVGVVVGYFWGYFFPVNFSGFLSMFSSEQSIQGDVRLLVLAKMKDTGTPVPNLEIDLAPKPGSPPLGGVGITDGNGVAEFNVRPGNYFIYYNQKYFPRNLIMPEPEQITVTEGAVNNKTILFILK